VRYRTANGTHAAADQGTGCRPAAGHSGDPGTRSGADQSTGDRSGPRAFTAAGEAENGGYEQDHCSRTHCIPPMI
jgi:hypothetical protein